MVLRVKPTPTRFPTDSLYTLAFYIKNEAMDVAQSAPRGAHYYHADVIYLLP